MFHITDVSEIQYRANLTDVTWNKEITIVFVNTSSTKIFKGIPEEQIAIGQSGNVILELAAIIITDAVVLAGDPVFWNTSTSVFTAIDSSNCVQVGTFDQSGNSGEKLTITISTKENSSEIDYISDVETQLNALSAQINPVETEGTVLAEIAAVKNRVNLLEANTNWIPLTNVVITATFGTITNPVIVDAEYKVSSQYDIYAFVEVFVNFTCGCSDTCDSIDINFNLPISFTSFRYYYRNVDEPTNFYAKNALWFDGEKITEADLTGVADQAGYDFVVSFKAKVVIT